MIAKEVVGYVFCNANLKSVLLLNLIFEILWGKKKFFFDDGETILITAS